MSGTLDENGYAEVSIADAPKSRVAVYCMVEDSEAEEGTKEISCDQKGEDGSLSVVISEGKIYANRGYQVDYFYNDPTKFAD